MGVYDRWHKTYPLATEEQCKEHNLVPSTDHGIGDRWQVRYRDDTGSQRKRNFRLKTGKNPDLHADAYDAKVQSSLAKGTWVSPSQGTVPLSEIYSQWIQSLLVDATTLYQRKVTIEKRIVDPLGHYTVWYLYENTERIQSWIKDLHAEGLAASTIREYVKYLSMILEYAVRKRMIPSHPIKGNPDIGIPSRTRRVVTPYTMQQLAAITEGLKPKYRPVVDIGSGLGLRIGEIYGLSPDDIQDDEIYVRRQLKFLHGGGGQRVFDLPKGGKTRCLPLPKTVADRLSQLPTSEVTLPWKHRDGKPTVVRTYLSSWGVPYDRRTLTQAYCRALASAGIVRLPYESLFHALRHTYASRLLKAGVDIRSLSAYLGHEDPGFTLRVYCHLMPGSGDSVRQAIDGH